MTTVSNITVQSASIPTAYQCAPAFAVIRHLAAVNGKLVREYSRPQMGRKAGYTGKVVYSPSTNRWYAVNSENNHSVQCLPVIWLNDSWQVVTSAARWFSKISVIVCK